MKKTITLFILLFILFSTGYSQSWSSKKGGAITGIPQWNFNIYDKYYIADVNGDGNDELIIIKGPNSAVYKMDWDANIVFQNLYYGTGGWIAGWAINDPDQYFTGDFNGDGKEELLCISGASSVWVKLLSFNQNNFNDIWHNGGGNTIGGWEFHEGDKFVVGDFSGRGRDELLCLAQNGWAMLLYYNGSSWVRVWANGGNDNIGGVNVIGTRSRFISGRFLQTTKDELFTVAGNTWATVIRYNPSRNDWDWCWSQYGTPTFANWALPLNDRDVIIPGNFDVSNANDELYFFRHGYSSDRDLFGRLIRRNSDNFASIWYGDRVYASGFPMAGYFRSITNKANYKGRNYLFHMVRDSRGGYLVQPYINLLQFNRNSSKSMEEENAIFQSTLSEKNRYKLYPNPSREFLAIERYSAENKGIYEIFNILGVKILEGKIPVGQLSDRIDLKDLKSGTYIVKIMDGDKSFMEKLIVN